MERVSHTQIGGEAQETARVHRVVARVEHLAALRASLIGALTDVVGTARLPTIRSD